MIFFRYNQGKIHVNNKGQIMKVTVENEKENVVKLNITVPAIEATKCL